MKSKSFIYCPILIFCICAVITFINYTYYPSHVLVYGVLLQMVFNLQYLPIGLLLAKSTIDVEQPLTKGQSIWAMFLILLPLFLWILRQYLSVYIMKFFFSNIKLLIIMSGYYLAIMLKSCHWKLMSSKKESRCPNEDEENQA